MRLLLVLYLALASIASAGDTPDLIIHDPMIRVAPVVGGTTAGYLQIENAGETADTLVSATTDAAMMVEIHEMVMSDGVMSMRPVAGGVPVPAGEAVQLAPRGLHLMIMKTTQSLPAGAVVPVTLRFENAGEIHVDFTVTPLGDILKSQ